jgi:hypothetical protein
MDLEMRFSPAINPETGLEPSGTVETIRATAYLAEREPGVWSHDGATDVDWDTQQPKRDADGRVLLADA